MTRRVFTAPDTWHGGFYELALELGERSDQRLLAALRRVWSFPAVDGCYLDWLVEPTEQPRVEPPAHLAEPGQLYGIARVPNGHEIACGTFIVREEDSGTDWLGFFLPTGALHDAYDLRGFPFDEGS